MKSTRHVMRDVTADLSTDYTTTSSRLNVYPKEAAN